MWQVLCILLVGLWFVVVAGWARNQNGDLIDETIFGFRFRITRQRTLSWNADRGVLFEVLSDQSGSRFKHLLTIHIAYRRFATVIYLSKINNKLSLWWHSEHIAIWLGKYHDNSELQGSGPADWWQYSGWLGNHIYC